MSRDTCEQCPATSGVERVTGIEPSWPAWKAGALPLSYTREVPGQPNGPDPRGALPTQAGLQVVAPDRAGRAQRSAALPVLGPVDLDDLPRPEVVLVSRREPGSVHPALAGQIGRLDAA